jgi:NADPH:quinone reductase-like Zn-dependent oxidoreductase
MKVVYQHRYGPAKEVLTVAEIDTPVPADNELLVRVRAASVNPIDTHVRGGYGRTLMEKKRGFDFPLTLGRDLSGTVEACGSKVRGFDVGAAIFAAPDPFRQGSHAEFIILKATEAFAKPLRLSFPEAASLPYAASTSWEALVNKAGLGPGRSAGKRVLVHAGSGGVGGVAIQMLKAWGAEVATTCSTRHVERVRALGADVIVDYTKADFAEELRDYDVVFDTLGVLQGPGFEPRSLRVLKRYGGAQYVSIVTPLLSTLDDNGLLKGLPKALWTLLTRKRRYRRDAGIGYHWAYFQPSSAAMQELQSLVEQGKIHAQVERSFALDEIVAAHEYQESGQATGKTMIINE